MAAIPSRSGFGPIHFTLIFSIKSLIFHTWIYLAPFMRFLVKKVRIIHQKILTTSFDKVDSLISLVFGPVLPTSKVRNFFHTGSSPCHICLLRHSQVKAFAAFSFHTTDCSIIYLPASFAQLSK